MNFSKDEIDVVRRYINRKCKQSGPRGVDFRLSLDNVIQLLSDANISPSDIGTRIGGYVLARKNENTGEVDTGPYEVGNCRFILHSDNISERIINRTDEYREKQRIAQTGKTVSSDARAKMSSSLLGNTRRLGHNHTDETKEKQRLASSGSRPVVVCPHCGHKGKYMALMKRKHFENCNSIN